MIIYIYIYVPTRYMCVYDYLYLYTDKINVRLNYIYNHIEFMYNIFPQAIKRISNCYDSLWIY